MTVRTAAPTPDQAGTALSRSELLALPASFPLWPAAGRAFGLGRSLTYDLAQRGEFPCRVLRIANKYRVTRADLLRALGETDDDASSGGDAA